MDKEAEHPVLKPCDKDQNLCVSSALLKNEEPSIGIGFPEDQGKEKEQQALEDPDGYLESSIGEKRKRSSKLDDSEEQTMESEESEEDEDEESEEEAEEMHVWQNQCMQDLECFSESEEISGMRVPLLSREEAGWRKFQEFDNGNPILHILSVDAHGFRERKTIDLDHPIVPVLRFAIKSYNEICMQAGKSHRIVFLDVVEIHYISVGFGYVYYIVFEASENEINGVYRAKVIINSRNVMKTLVTLVRTSRPPVGKKNEKLYAECFDMEPKSKTEAENKPVKSRINEVAEEGLLPRDKHQRSFDYINPLKGFQHFFY